MENTSQSVNGGGLSSAALVKSQVSFSSKRKLLVLSGFYYKISLSKATYVKMIVSKWDNIVSALH